MIDWNALYKVSLGLYVLGAKDEARLVGSVVDAVMIAANKPCALAVSCNNASYTKSCIEKTHQFSLSVLGKQTSPSLIANFGFQSSKYVNKWQNTDFDFIDGLPVLKQSLAQIRANVIHQYPLESNTVFIAEITQAILIDNSSGLLYDDYRFNLKDDVIKIFQQHNKEKPNG